MTPTPKRREPIRFVRGRRLYQIARAYTGEDGYVGIVDGRVVARAAEAATVARTLIKREVGLTGTGSV